MRLEHLKNWSFLSFLVLFLNFGPSFHRAHFWGLHSHSSADGIESSSCDSCCHHAGSAVSIDSPNSHEPPVPQLTAKSSHTCAVCQFFKNYLVTLTTTETLAAVVPVSCCWLSSESSTSANSILAIARGPPSFCS